MTLWAARRRARARIRAREVRARIREGEGAGAGDPLRRGACAAGRGREGERGDSRGWRGILSRTRSGKVRGRDGDGGAARRGARGGDGAPGGRDRGSPRGRRSEILWAGVVLGAAGAAWLAAPHAAERLASLLRSHALRVETIAVEGARRLSADAVATAAGVAPGMALFDIDVRDVEAQVSAHPWVQSTNAVRLPPSTLLVKIEERIPIAVAALGPDLERRVVDASGLPFAPAGEEELATLPRLISPGVLQRLDPDRRSPELARAARLAEALFELDRGPPVEIGLAPDSDPEGLSFRLEGLDARAILGRGDPQLKLARFVRLLRAGRPETAAAARIDLRFADQVVLSGFAPHGGATGAAPRTAAPASVRPAG